MRFAAPTALWGLAVLPLIVLLYMLRSRRQDVPASSVLLWQRARRDLAAQLPVRRLERSLLLILQLLAATLVVLALARPQVALPLAGGQATVIVVDTSASMQATDVTPSRFDAARSQAVALAASAGGPVMVIEAGPQPRVLTPFGDGTRARAVLSRLRPTDAPARLEQAVILAVGQRTSRGNPDVIVFTDRASTPLAGVTYRIVGRSQDNLAIAAMRTERAPDGTRVVIQVRNTGSQPVRAPLVLTLDDRRVLERAVSLPANGTGAVTVAVKGQGILRAQLMVQDALAVDNVGYAVVGAPRPRVLVVGAPDRVLNEALAALDVRAAPASQPTAEALAAADVVILNRTPPVDLPPGNYLLLGTMATNLPLTGDGAVRAPQVVRWSHTHPVMRYVDLTGVTIGEALALRPKGGEVLAGGEVPLIWVYDGDGIRAVVVGFSLDQSDLPLQVGFPILLSNALHWLAGGDQVYQAGDALILPAGAQREAVVSDPTGARTALTAAGGRFVIPALERVGIYTVRIGDRERIVAVNPSVDESVIAPVPATGPGATSARTDRRGERIADLWTVVLGLALVVLLGEWVLWLRTLPRTHLTRARAVVRR